MNTRWPRGDEFLDLRPHGNVDHEGGDAEIGSGGEVR
jgi:hypothetical protein